MSYVSIILSGAASLGVLIALISGIFFLVLTGLRWVSRVREALYDEELRRHKKILGNGSSVGSQDILGTRKTENGLGSTFNENREEKEFQSFQSNGGNGMKWNENQAEEKTSKKQEPSSDTIQVREFIEKMVEALIGGPLDGTTVGKLSEHSACKGAIELDSSNFSQRNLKRLIKRVVSEAMALPNISEISGKEKTVKEAVTDDFKNKSYEDILATAILNKVIEHFQNRENESIENKPKPRPRSRKLRTNPEDDDQKSNSDWSDASRSDQLSLTIEEYIEEVTTAMEASEDERSDFSDFESNINRRIPFPEAGRTVVDGTDDENSDAEEQSSATELFTSTSSWEENWLFQKKRLPSTPNAHHPVPVPMLVPNPSEDYRALVGGVDADDLSDISDCCDLMEDPNAEKKPLIQLSKLESEEVSCPDAAEDLDENKNRKEPKGDLKEITPDKPPVIGKEISSDFSPINLEEEGNMTLTAASEAEDEASEEEMSDSVKLNSSPTSPSQKDREFSVEHFDLLQQCESLCRDESSIGTTQTSRSENGSIRSIAEREKEKWNNPVLLADNPYSLENIERRAQRKKNDFFRIGTYTGESICFPEDLSSDELTKSSENLRIIRDYYINDSKNPSGKSSSSLGRLPKGHEQKSPTNEKNKTHRENEDFMMEENHGTSQMEKINKKEFSLPNVKELAKQFTLQNAKETKRTGNDPGNKLENKQRVRSFDAEAGTPRREPELDYSTIPVSEIISNLQQSKQSPVQEKKHVPYENFQPKTQIEIFRKAIDDEDRKFGRFNGKEVHSLTARSISKEFREGLKNNSYQNVFLKINRAAMPGENDQRDVAYAEKETSPTPSIDLKNMKKFWEEIITANANATKQK